MINPKGEDIFRKPEYAKEYDRLASNPDVCEHGIDDQGRIYFHYLNGLTFRYTRSQFYKICKNKPLPTPMHTTNYSLVMLQDGEIQKIDDSVNDDTPVAYVRTVLDEDGNIITRDEAVIDDEWISYSKHNKIPFGQIIETCKETGAYFVISNGNIFFQSPDGVKFSDPNLKKLTPAAESLIEKLDEATALDLSGFKLQDQFSDFCDETLMWKLNDFKYLELY